MDSTASKLVLLLAARGGVDRTELEALLRDETKLLRSRLPEGGRVAAFLRLEEDPFDAAPTRIRAFEGTLELRCDAGDALASAVDGFAARVADRVHTDLSAALSGVDDTVVPCEQTPFRFQYVMRRRRDKSHAEYLDHYVKIHAEFGRITPGIEGYVQFHVDPEAARAAAAAAGLGGWSADSISELHLGSVQGFLDEIARWSRNGEAQADEENFVDRMNSVMFT
ncbi:MAG: EthD domain-containing protein, partial [Myxococcota bacterium]|nr:EthD domain-containing protein [Myxococcota bacterium]